MPFLRPGDGYRQFMVKRKGTSVDDGGNVRKGVFSEIGQIIGILINANEKEKEQWKQKGHPISHCIIQRGVKNKAEATDYIVLEGKEPGEKSRYFYVQGSKNHGNLDHLLKYYVEERKDLKNG